MAVQQRKKSKSRRNMRRSHNALSNPAISIDQETGEAHLRHHVTPSGFYRGRRVVPLEPEVEEEEQQQH